MSQAWVLFACQWLTSGLYCLAYSLIATPSVPSARRFLPKQHGFSLVEIDSLCGEEIYATTAYV
jgi:hypothetical protein